MVPKLYVHKASAPSRATIMCAKELGLNVELVQVDLFSGAHLTDDYLKKNPQHTVPLLEDDDGFIVSDSHAIMAYLVAKYGKNDDLCPIKDYKRRAVIDHRLHFDSHLLFGRAAQISVPLFFNGIKPTKEKLDGVKDALKSLEKILGDNKTDYVGGDSLSIADFSIFTTLGLVNNFVPIADYPNIMNYVKTIQKLPCQEVNKEGAAMLDAFISAALQK